MKRDRGAGLPPRPLLFGEVLHDVYPDATATLGGAPFNVAWHLRGFGYTPLLISRIGNDELGERVLTAMSAWDMDTRAVQIDPVHATGQVQVSFAAGEPRFEIMPDQAYDFIDAAPLRKVLSRPPAALLYHGSLIARQAISRDSLEIARASGAPVFLDINLRDPWWTRDWLGNALRRARWLKLNEHELAMVLQRPLHDEQDLLVGAEDLRRVCGGELLIVTRGERGAVVITESKIHQTAPASGLDGFIDSVGAGDAFSAVAIIGVLNGWPLSMLAERAVDFAAAVCRQRGAIARDRALYQRYAKEWTT